MTSLSFRTTQEIKDKLAERFYWTHELKVIYFGAQQLLWRVTHQVVVICGL